MSHVNCSWETENKHLCAHEGLSKRIYVPAETWHTKRFYPQCLGALLLDDALHSQKWLVLRHTEETKYVHYLFYCSVLGSLHGAWRGLPVICVCFCLSCIVEHRIVCCRYDLSWSVFFLCFLGFFFFLSAWFLQRWWKIWKNHLQWNAITLPKLVFPEFKHCSETIMTFKMITEQKGAWKRGFNFPPELLPLWPSVTEVFCFCFIPHTVLTESLILKPFQKLHLISES